MAPAVAGGASGNLLKGDAPVAPAGDLLSRAVAGLATPWRGPRLGARVLEGRADGGMPQMHRLFTTGENPLQRDLEIHLEVRTLRRACRTVTPAEEAVAEPAASKIKAQAAEDIFKIHLSKEIFWREAGHSRHATGIVLGALLQIRQHGIGRSNLLEAFLSVWRFVAVRVLLQRQLAKGVLDSLLIGVSGDTKHFVVIMWYCWHNRRPISHVRRVYRALYSASTTRP
jgi:hypothetical protein